MVARIAAELQRLDREAPLPPLQLPRSRLTLPISPPPSPPPSSVPLGPLVDSLLWLPASQQWLRPLAAELIARLAGGVDAVLAAADEGALHLAPGLMGEVQVLYDTPHALLT